LRKVSRHKTSNQNP